VSDFATALLMDRFHENMFENGMGKARALREAQIWLRDLRIEELEAFLDAHAETLGPAYIEVTYRMSGMYQGALDWFKDDLRARGSQPFANPFWWAAFQCIGSGWPSVSL